MRKDKKHFIIIIIGILIVCVACQRISDNKHEQEKVEQQNEIKIQTNNVYLNEKTDKLSEIEKVTSASVKLYHLGDDSDEYVLDQYGLYTVNDLFSYYMSSLDYLNQQYAYSEIWDSKYSHLAFSLNYLINALKEYKVGNLTPTDTGDIPSSSKQVMINCYKDAYEELEKYVDATQTE